MSKIPGWIGHHDLEVRLRDPLPAHLADAAAVEAVFTPPAQWLAVRQRWAAFIDTSTPHVDQLLQHITSGAGDLPGLRAAALAELAATGAADAELRQQLAVRVCHELTRLWPAEKAYTAAAKAFDAAVRAFSGSDETELDHAAIALVAAARLCGAERNAAKWATDRLQFTLCVDPRRAHLRKLVTAFVVPGEAQREYGTGRWNALLKLGAGLRAATDPLRAAPELPAHVTCVDEHRVIQRWDPLDGEPPTGWRQVPDGWIGG
ncbi:hypothetical protein PJJ83_08000 [Mycobacterium kansasii]